MNPDIMRLLMESSGLFGAAPASEEQNVYGLLGIPEGPPKKPVRKGLTGEDLMYGKAQSELDAAIKQRKTIRELIGLIKNRLTPADLDSANQQVEGLDPNWRYYNGRASR